jgi:maleate isomerase
MDLEPSTRRIRQFPFTTDSGIGARASIGLIVLASDQTIEHEFRLMTALPGVALYESRLYNANDITPATLRAMEAEIAPATRLILPGVGLDVVGFGCTSAAMLLGEDIVGARIHEARPGVAFTTPVTGALAGLGALGARRIAVLTPYSDDVNEGIRDYIERRGLAVVAMGSFKEPDDRRVARISPDSILAAAQALVCGSGAEALFVSCTSLRLVEHVATLEACVGIPATSSNHALGWHCLRLAGIDDAMPHFGRLFCLKAPARFQAAAR